MKLVLREYLAMLRESGELDVLLPDLLLAMGFDLLVRPGSGSRQFGVDLSAVGADPDDRAAGEKLFLITIKRGNIGRADWNGSLQAVRPSLDEILDSFLPNLVRPEHSSLPKKVVLATGGDLRQEVAPDWTNYTKANRNRYPQYGSIEFDFWGGDRLAQLLEEHLFDEFLFPDSARKQLRKTIALADQADEPPEQFFALVHDVLFERGLPTGTSSGNIGARRKAFHLLDLSLLVVYRWCEEAGNLRNACLAAERTLLTAWDWMRQSDLLDCAATRASFTRLANTYRRILLTFAIKLRPHSKVRDGLMVLDEIENSLRVFEVIGLLGSLTCAFAYEAEHAATLEQADDLAAAAMDVANILVDVITHNPAAYLPLYDQHGIDIGIGLLALAITTPPAAARTWVERTAAMVMAAIRAKRCYPVASDSYEDLLALRGPNPPEHEKLLELSTLLPLISEWMAILEMSHQYTQLRAAIAATIPETDLQLWFPDVATDGFLYRTNAGDESGATLTSLQLPETVAELRDRIRRVASSQASWTDLSCLRQGWTFGALLASRHFRTPLIPALWQDALDPTQTESAGAAHPSGSVEVTTSALLT